MSVSKAVLTTGTLTYGGTAYPLTAMSYNESVAIQDLTDTATTGDGKEFVYGRVDRKFSIDVWMDVSGSDVPLKTKNSLILNFEGKQYAGSGSFETRDVKSTIDTGIKVTLTGQFSGAVTASHA